MKVVAVLGALVALCGVALAIFSADTGLHVLGIVLGLVGVIASIWAATRPVH